MICVFRWLVMFGLTCCALGGSLIVIFALTQPDPQAGPLIYLGAWSLLSLAALAFMTQAARPRAVNLTSVTPPPLRERGADS